MCIYSTYNMYMCITSSAATRRNYTYTTTQHTVRGANKLYQLIWNQCLIIINIYIFRFVRASCYRIICLLYKFPVNPPHSAALYNNEQIYFRLNLLAVQ